jgi:hypothetical protein
VGQQGNCQIDEEKELTHKTPKEKGGAKNK